MTITAYLIFELISLLASLSLYFQKSMPGYMKLFPVFIFVTIVVEIIGGMLMDRGIPNVLLYNLFFTVEFVFYLFILRNFVHSRKVKKLIFYISLVYPVLALINIFFIQVNTFESITYSLGCLLIVGVCVYYFLELFQLPHSVNLKREPAFWICSGLLFFYCCSFPLFGLNNYLLSTSGVILQNLTSILSVINILLYSLFTIAFLCRVKFRKAIIEENK